MRHRWPVVVVLWLVLVGLVAAAAAGVGGIELATEAGGAAGAEPATDVGGGAAGAEPATTGAVLLALALVTILVPVVLIDLAVRVIPNWLTAAGAAAALAIGLATDPSAVPERLLAAAAAGGFLLLAALVRPGDLGMGDVKLVAVLGLFLGASVAVALLAGLVAAALAGAFVLVRGRRAGGAREATLPLGPFLALGAVIALLAGPALLDAYLG